MLSRGLFSHRTSARRLLLTLAGLGLALGMLPVAAGAVPGSAASHARADDLTVGQNPMRTSWDSSESSASIGPSVVPGFAQRFSDTVSGGVFAQPLVLGSTVYVATENDQVYAFNAGTGAQIWHTSLGSPFNITKVSSLSKCTDLVPNIGITGTPVYDSSTNELYMFANIVNPGTNTPHYYLVGLNATTGAVEQQIHPPWQPQQRLPPGVQCPAADGAARRAAAAGWVGGRGVRLPLRHQALRRLCDAGGPVHRRVQHLER